MSFEHYGISIYICDYCDIELRGVEASDRG